MAKEICYDEISRQKLKKGMDMVADAVKVTLGPKGRNGVLEKPYFAPVVTNDGVTIANAIDLADPYENIGAQLLKEVASKTNDVAGDGTTTAIVLAQAMIEEGMKNLAVGANPVFLKKGIEQAVAKAVAEIEHLAKPVHTETEIRQVAVVSSEDEAIGALVAEAVQKVGDENSIVVENSQTMNSYLDIKPGFSFERGFVSANMINVPELSQCVYEDVDILFIDRSFKTMNDIYPILELALERRKPMLMVVDGLEGEALQAVNMNNARGVLSIVAVQGPTHGENRQRELLDMEALVGGQAIVGEIDALTDKITAEMLGHAQRIVVDKNKTTIVGGIADESKVAQRVARIREEMQEYTSEFTTQVCQSRLQRLAGAAVVLKVGASTEAEYNEKKLRIEDALHAVQAARAEGIVAGGGTAFLRVQASLSSLDSSEADVRTGIHIVYQALEKPLGQIAQNAGQEPSVIVEAVRALAEDEGYNALTGRYENMLSSGIIDSAKVTKAALQNAASIAMLALTAEAAVVDAPEKKEDDEEK